MGNSENRAPPPPLWSDLRGIVYWGLLSAWATLLVRGERLWWKSGAHGRLVLGESLVGAFGPPRNRTTPWAGVSTGRTEVINRFIALFFHLLHVAPSDLELGLCVDDCGSAGELTATGVLAALPGHRQGREEGQGP